MKAIRDGTDCAADRSGLLGVESLGNETMTNTQSFSLVCLRDQIAWLLRSTGQSVVPDLGQAGMRTFDATIWLVDGLGNNDGHRNLPLGTLRK